MNQAQERPGRSERLFGFPGGCEEAADRACGRSGGGTPGWVIPGRDRAPVRELVPLTLLCLGVPGRWVWKPESHPVAVV